jgi:hypothetical protein
LDAIKKSLEDSINALREGFKVALGERDTKITELEKAQKENKEATTNQITAVQTSINKMMEEQARFFSKWEGRSSSASTTRTTSPARSEALSQGVEDQRGASPNTPRSEGNKRGSRSNKKSAQTSQNQTTPHNPL